jgi:hypothetical protein
MVDIDEATGTTVLRRTSPYRPPGFWRKWLIGRPLSTADAAHQTIGKTIGLAVFASDALSSTAYATQEILHRVTKLLSSGSVSGTSRHSG